MGSLTQQLLVTYLGSVTKMVTMINRTQFKPIKKSLNLSRSLWAFVDNYSERNNISRAKTMERIVLFFIQSADRDLIIDYRTKKIELAVIEQQLKNKKEVKQLMEE